MQLLQVGVNSGKGITDLFVEITLSKVGQAVLGLVRQLQGLQGTRCSLSDGLYGQSRKNLLLSKAPRKASVCIQCCWRDWHTKKLEWDFQSLPWVHLAYLLLNLAYDREMLLAPFSSSGEEGRMLSVWSMVMCQKYGLLGLRTACKTTACHSVQLCSSQNEQHFCTSSKKSGIIASSFILYLAWQLLATRIMIPRFPLKEKQDNKPLKKAKRSHNESIACAKINHQAIKKKTSYCINMPRSGWFFPHSTWILSQTLKTAWSEGRRKKPEETACHSGAFNSKPKLPGSHQPAVRWPEPDIQVKEDRAHQEMKEGASLTLKCWRWDTQARQARTVWRTGDEQLQCGLIEASPASRVMSLTCSPHPSLLMVSSVCSGPLR